MTSRALLLSIVLSISSPTWAQVRPEPDAGTDPRIRSVLYDPGQVVLIEAAPGFQVTIQLSPGEQIDNVAVGDSAAWQVTPSRRGDMLVVKPVQGGITSNLSVMTDGHSYVFMLAPGDSATMPFLVRFRYPLPTSAIEVVGSGRVSAGWRLSGDRALRPATIESDDAHIYLTWPSGGELPAVFAVDARGKETLVNGMIRDGAFVIDGLADQLLFRIDRREARARWSTSGRKH